MCNFATLLGLWIAYEASPATMQARIGHVLLTCGALASILVYGAFAWFVMKPITHEAAAAKKRPSTDRNDELIEVYADVILDWLKWHCQTSCFFATEAMAKDVNLSVDRVQAGLEKLEKLTLVSRDALSWKFVAANAVRAIPGYTRRKESRPNPDVLCEELRQIASQDAERLRERIQEISQRIEFHFSPGEDPSIDIVTELWNGSIFDLVNIGEISGHVTYAGKQLASEPRIMVPVEPVLLHLARGERMAFTVRQYLSSDMADMMETNRNRQVVIDFLGISVPFKLVPLPGFSKQLTFTWFGPRFAIEDAVRV